MTARVLGALALALLAACGGSSPGGSPTGDPGVILVRSSVFQHQGHIPPRYSCDGEGVSPPVTWSGLPQDTFEVAVVVTDPDAPGGDFVHWTIWGLDPSLEGLAEGAVPRGALQGTNGSGTIGWFPPCPPKGETHRYVFTVFAVRAGLPLEEGAPAREVLQAIEDRLTGEGGLVGNFGRF